MTNATMGTKGRSTAMALLLGLFAFVPAAMGQDPRIERTISLAIAGSYLGIEMEEVTADNMSSYKLSAERGVIVRAVERGSPAEAGNVQEKDVILEYAGIPVLSTAQLARMVHETPPGRKVDLIVSRDGKRVNLTAKVGKREGPMGSRNRGMRVRPRFEDREFWFDGPDRQVFRFGMPGESGRGFAFALPDRGEFTGKLRLGVTLENLTDQMAEFLGVPGKRGALVTSVTDGSPAAAAKLRAGDVIVRADNRSIEDSEDLQRVLRGMGSGGKLELKVIRDKKEITVTIDLPKDERKPGGYKM